MDGRRIKFIVIGLGIAATMVFMLVVATQKSDGGFAYYVTVQEFREKGQPEGRFRVRGDLLGTVAIEQGEHGAGEAGFGDDAEVEFADDHHFLVGDRGGLAAPNATNYRRADRKGLRTVSWRSNVCPSCRSSE